MLTNLCVDLIKVLFFRFWGTHSWGWGGRDIRTVVTKIFGQK